MINQPLLRTLADTLPVLLQLDRVQPSKALPKRLGSLFAALRNPDSSEPPEEIESLIWSLWTDHADPGAARRMDQAIAAITNRNYRRAEKILDQLVRDHPDWAEAWNRRASLYYALRRDAESIADIRRTLALEPRHFGALLGFAQISLRHGDIATALVAFQTALRINPALYPVDAVIQELKERLRNRMH